MSCFAETQGALVWRRGRETLRIEPWGRDSLRVRAVPEGDVMDQPAWALQERPADAPASRAAVTITDTAATIVHGAIAAEVGQGGQIRFLRSADRSELLAEEPIHFIAPPARHYRLVPGADHFWLEVRFRAYDGERVWGLGQHQHGRLDQKGCVIDLIQRNTEVSIPFMLSSRGYGFLWNNPAVGRLDLGHNLTRWTAESTRQLDYWITAADTPAAIVERYTDVVGRAPLLPSWAAGFWQCKLRYRTQDELLAVAREYRRRGLPLDVIVIDFFHWTAQGDWAFDPECWPDPDAMVRELDTLGVRVMVSIWPTVNPDSVNYSDMVQRGLLIGSDRGNPAHVLFWDTGFKHKVYVQFYDATHPEARKFIWEKARDSYYRRGIKIWWLDACEPEMYPMDPENARYHAGSGAAVGNIYPLMHSQTFYDGMRSEGETEIISLCRSAWAGSQRYAAAVWSGDVPSTFEALRAQVVAGLNIGLSGIPWWTTDIGGFREGEAASSAFRELLVRWFQYGTFCPLFRLHGYRLPTHDLCGADNEVWSYGDEAYAIFRDLLLLRERLRPYIMEQMGKASHTGAPPMRPLFFDFPDDARCQAVADQFMFGPDLLVAPVLAEGARSREVYLPAGTQWTDAWTGRQIDGGCTLTAPAPLDRIPLYLRNGATLPIRG
ncbi:MAG: glycoside hydrolase family 31 protein [Phycisphaerae bacterium]|nr:glycoside hydrolase family 31 protein [Phycisphaerae bacterium]